MFINYLESSCTNYLFIVIHMIIKVVLVLHARTRCLCLLGCLLCRTFNGIVSARLTMHSKWMEEEMSHQHSKFVRLLMHKTHWSNPLTTQASPCHYKYKMFSVLYVRISAYVYVFHFVNTDDITVFFCLPKSSCFRAIHMPSECHRQSFQSVGSSIQGHFARNACSSRLNQIFGSKMDHRKS